MRRPTLLSCSLLSCSFLSALSLPLAAQDTDDSDIETLTITATRIPLARGDVAAPVTVITGVELDNRGINRISDALDTVPGLQIQRGASVGGQTQLRLRGAEANQTLILIDGVEANDPGAADEVQLENLLIADIERIEIVRGPQSVAWGSDALAGVINIVTKQQSDPFSASFSAEGGSFGTFRSKGALGAAGDGWHIRGGVSYVDQRGVNASRVGGEDDGYRNITANVKAGAALGDDFDLLVTARHTDARTEFDAIDFLTTGLPADSANQSDTRNTYLSAQIKGTLFAGALKPSVRVTYLDTLIDNTVGGAPDGTTAGERLGLYADLSWTPIEGHSVTFLVDHEDTEFAQTGLATPFGNPNQVQDQDNTGFAANYTGQWLTGLTVTASVRHDDNSAFEDITTWRAGAAYYSPYSGSRFYVSVGRGQKAPTFTELFGFFADQFQGNPNLTPERSVNTEIGWEQAWLGGAVNTRLSYFNADLENEINGFVFDPDTFLFTAENVDGDSQREGVEVEIDWTVSEQLSITGSYAYLDATEDDGFGNQIEEIRRPDHTAFLAVNYAPTDKLNLNITANYRSEATDLFFPPFPNPPETVVLDDYVLINVNARYRATEWLEIYGRIENLADENFEDIFGFNTPDFGAFAGLRVTY